MPSKVEKMRDTLLYAIEQVKCGVMPPERAKAMAALAHQVNASLDVELRVLLAAKVKPEGVAHLAAPAPETAGPSVRSIGSGVVERSDGITRHTIGDE